MKYFKKLEGEHIYISPMNIEDAEKYAVLNNRTLQVEVNPHYIEKHILDLFGFKLNFDKFEL